jgi:hypothetical protein
MGVANGVWEKFGLLAPRVFRARTGDPKYASLSRAVRFRMALEEQGELFRVFAAYLTGRADLLPSPHLRQLNRVRLSGRGPVRAVAERDLGGKVAGLERIRCFSTGESFAGTFNGRPVVVDCVPPDWRSVPDAGWNSFRNSLSKLEDVPESAVSSGKVLDQFREWYDLCGNLERKRTILKNLTASSDANVWVYPAMVGELQTECCLAYEECGGTPLDDALAAGADDRVKSLETWVEGLVEQTLLLALIDAEMQPGCVRLLAGGRAGYHCIPALAPVPVEWSYELIQYLACSAGGNSPRALHMLSRMSANTNAYAGEQHLMRQLSALQPELKINEVTPATITALENNWRALAATRMVAPSFLELFHRQWTQVGQYNGEIAPASDFLADSMWPVMGKILRHQMSEVMTAGNIKEWTASSALLLLSSFRQLGMTLEQVRDNDLAITVDEQEYEGRGAKSNRRIYTLVRASMALVGFIAATRFAAESASGLTQLFSGLAAVAAAVALSVFVARIE